MNEAARQALSETVIDVAHQRINPRTKGVPLASVRVPPGAYLATMSAFTFMALALIRAERDLSALAALAIAWIITPALAFNDRISFDGQTLQRRGFVASILRIIRGRALKLPLAEVERVETSAVRTLRRGGRVRYRYRSEVRGNGLNFTFASGGKSYGRMVRALFPSILDDKLDVRSGELRDYLADTKDLCLKLKLLQIAPPSVLDDANTDFPHPVKNNRHQRTNVIGSASEAEAERAQSLRHVANSLRMAGRLREAGEAFRRALLMTPRDGWLLYEFARFLRSQASAIGDAQMLTRARAGLRLAAQRGDNDAALLSRIGESFSEYGDLRQAIKAFRRALDLDLHAFRAEIGLAEVALRQGKLAHVIHHYGAAAHMAADQALARFARREADYYARLNNDDDYLAAELRRINWLQNAEHARRIAARMTFASILIALVGLFFEESFSAVGWSLASSAIFAWISIAIVIKLLTPRRKARPAE